ncbi:unnamed protein product, partial [Hydatigera taeniaeformis]|uniref:Ovule protein n=1 Tax=Hydatigena taeniaeformis TaxID=6205 RepID=A0A0R3WYV8_HYDTA
FFIFLFFIIIVVVLIVVLFHLLIVVILVFKVSFLVFVVLIILISFEEEKPQVTCRNDWHYSGRSMEPDPIAVNRRDPISLKIEIVPPSKDNKSKLEL